MKRATLLLLAALLLCTSFTPPWGFFGHRRINRLAVFTLDMEMMPFFRYHLEYLTEHAVDADKRRYATRHEAVRHYIDLDRWGKYPFPDLPRDWTTALLRHAELRWSGGGGDTLGWRVDSLPWPEQGGVEVLIKNKDGRRDTLPLTAYRTWFARHVISQYYDDAWTVPADTLRQVLPLPAGVRGPVTIIDSLSPHGILPYHLVRMQERLTEAFRARDARAILRLCADMGHYIGDAHVPLHTTQNYNGQLTGQLGIHAFWESRLPELFADAEYDFFVGKAAYINNPTDFYWDMVLTSHQLVDTVLATEQRLRREFPADRQFCFDQRPGGAVLRTQCEAYARAYQAALGGMVEQRMRAAVHALGSAWYTAWVDAGQPELRELVGELTPEEVVEAKARLRVREHE